MNNEDSVGVNRSLDFWRLPYNIQNFSWKSNSTTRAKSDSAAVTKQTNKNKPRSAFVWMSVWTWAGKTDANDQTRFWQLSWQTPAPGYKITFNLGGFTEQTGGGVTRGEVEGEKRQGMIEQAYELLSRHAAPPLLAAGDNRDHPSSCPPFCPTHLHPGQPRNTTGFLHYSRDVSEPRAVGTVTFLRCCK